MPSPLARRKVTDGPDLTDEALLELDAVWLGLDVDEEVPRRSVRILAKAVGGRLQSWH